MVKKRLDFLSNFHNLNWNRCALASTGRGTRDPSENGVASISKVTGTASKALMLHSSHLSTNITTYDKPSDRKSSSVSFRSPIKLMEVWFSLMP